MVVYTNYLIYCPAGCGVCVFVCMDEPSVNVLIGLPAPFHISWKTLRCTSEDLWHTSSTLQYIHFMLAQ